MTDGNPHSDNTNMVMNVLGQIGMGSRYSQIAMINHDYHVPGVLQDQRKIRASCLELKQYKGLQLIRLTSRGQQHFIDFNGDVL